MSWGRYLSGLGALAAMLAPLIFGAFRLRARVLPGLPVAVARLAEGVLVVAGLLGAACMLGAIDSFRLVPLVVACVLIGMAAAWFGRGGDVGDASPGVRAQVGAPVLVGVAVIAVIFGAWIAATATTVGRGM